MRLKVIAYDKHHDAHRCDAIPDHGEVYLVDLFGAYGFKEEGAMTKYSVVGKTIEVSNMVSFILIAVDPTIVEEPVLEVTE